MLILDKTNIGNSVQVNLQPTLEERYAGNVWETTKLIYDIGYRKKTAEYDGLIVVLNKNQGIYRKSNDRKDWFVFTNTAYKKALSGEKGNNQNTNDVSNDQYEALQQQIDTLQKQLNNKSNQKRVAPQRKQMPKKQPSVTQKNNTNDMTNNKVILIKLQNVMLESSSSPNEIVMIEINIYSAYFIFKLTKFFNDLFFIFFYLSNF